MASAKPIPFLRGEERAWFDAARESRLMFQQCESCGAVPNYPRSVCPTCWSPALQERTSAGHGIVYSFTTQYRPGAPGFADEVPYTLALVELDEGFRVLADLRDCPDEDLAVGLPVRAIFDEVSPNFTLPRFVPSNGEAAT